MKKPKSLCLNRQKYVALESKTPVGLEEPQGPFGALLSQGSYPDSVIAGRLSEETHGLFKHSQTLDGTPLLPGEHFLYPHVTCHEICLTQAAINSTSPAGSVVTGESLNNPVAKDCLLLKSSVGYLVT